MIIFLIFIIILILLFIEPFIINLKLENNNEYGSSRFAYKSEIKKNFSCEKLKKIKNAGVPIYFNRSLKKCWFDNITSHYIYLGSSGSGKTSTIVIPMCTFFAHAKNKKSLIITDPKQEIFNLTSKMFEDNGFEIVTIDFRNYNFSNKLNLLENVIKEYDRYIEFKEVNKEISFKKLSNVQNYIKDISSLIFNNGKSKDPFWENSAKNLLIGFIYLFLEEYGNKKIKKEQMNFYNLSEFSINVSDEEKREKLKLYLELKDEKDYSKSYLTGILNSSENVLKSIISVYEEKMSVFKNITVRSITSTTDFNIENISKKPTILYIIVPDELPIFNINVTLILNIIYRTLIELANNNESGKTEIGIEWLLDEFGNFPPLNNIQNVVSISRSRGMRFHFFIQSFSQLYNVYGKDISQIILDNCGLIYLKTNNYQTAVEVSKRLGKKTLESKSLSYTRNQKNEANITKSLISRELMTPKEIEQLHFKTIIFPVKGNPILRKTILYKNLKCYKDGEYKRKNKMDTQFLNLTLNSILYFNTKKSSIDIIKNFIEEFKNITVLEIKENEQLILNRELNKKEIELLKKISREKKINLTIENQKVILLE